MLQRRRRLEVNHAAETERLTSRTQLRTRSLAALLGVLVLAVVAWPFAREHLQAVAMLRLVSGQSVPWIIRKLATEPVRNDEVQFATEAGVVRGRLYLPQRHQNAPGLVVLHGVHHLGMDEPRLVRFATAMASCGLRVLTPELPGIKDYHVDRSSVQVIGESARWFAEKTGEPVGVLGLSFSGGLALVAANDPVYRKDFKFVFAVGSQDEMGHVANYYLTGQEVRPDGTIERLKPHEYGAAGAGV